jgi:serine/threonine protein kinase
MISLLEPKNAFNHIRRNEKIQFPNKNYTDLESKQEIPQKMNFLKGNISINNNILLKQNDINLDLSQTKGVIDSKYYLLKKIGKGSSAKVYLATSKDYLESNDINNFDNINNIKYLSIKVVDPLKMDINMFKKEVELLQNISHENILKIYSYGIGKKEKIKNNQKISKEIYYIVMEYLDHGESLQYITKVCKGENKGFGEDFARLIFAQLLDALEEMHSKNIFHRDIKPDNIMIGGDDYKFKFVDFGFSTNNIGKLNLYLGTPTYAAPELHLKRPYFAKSVDIFSLGVSLFVLVTGGLPFKLAVPNDSFYQYFIKCDYVEYWRKRMVNVSPNFMELFDNMAAFDFSQRPSISEIRESAWMKEINWDLLPYLKQELILRETIINERKNEELLQKIRLKQEIQNSQEKNISLLKTKKQIKRSNYINIENKNNFCNNDFNNSKKNYVTINKPVNIINTNKIIINLEDINYKNNINNNKIINNDEEKSNMIIERNGNKIISDNLEDNLLDEDKNEKMKETNNNIQNNEQLSNGFIKLQIESKNLNMAMTKIKKYLKNKGYYSTKSNSNELELVVSDGEIDILLKIEKYKKDYVKLNYFKMKGMMTQFESFKKQIHSLKTKIF